MRKKIKKKYIQTMMFDDDEEIVAVKSSKSMKYSPYVKGAVDMFLKFIKEQDKVNCNLYDRGQTNIIHLPRKYMEAFVLKAIRDKTFLNNFLWGYKPKFDVVRDDTGKIKKIVVSLYGDS